MNQNELLGFWQLSFSPGADLNHGHGMDIILEGT